MIDIQQALIDPATTFTSPKDVLIRNDLARHLKIKILKRWESDIREILVAEEENMQGKDVGETLTAIRQALHSLDAEIDTEDTPPTKQGG